MSSLRLALKQSLQDATPPLVSTTESSSNGGITTNIGGGGSSAASAAAATTTTTAARTSGTDHSTSGTTTTNHNRRWKENSKIRPRNDDNDDQSTSSEENEASLKDLDDMDDDDDDDSSIDEHEDVTRNDDRSRITHSHPTNHSKPNKIKVGPHQQHHQQQQRNSNDAAANRIQKQYRKTKKKHAPKTTATTAMSSSSSTGNNNSHHHHHHHSQSRTKIVAVLNKKKQKRDKHSTKSSTNHRAANVRVGSTRDSIEEEEEYRRDSSTDHLHQNHQDHSDDDNDDSSNDSSSSWTVIAPSETVIRHMASLSNDTCIQNMVPGLRVKVLFDKPIRKWYGGYIEQIYDTTTTTTSHTNAKEAPLSHSNSSALPQQQQHPPTLSSSQTLRRIKIAYDDGTSEMTHFPDRKLNSMTTAITNVTHSPPFEDAIVIDAMQNGQHMTATAQQMAQQVYTPSSFAAPIPVLVAPKNNVTLPALASWQEPPSTEKEAVVLSAFQSNNHDNSTRKEEQPGINESVTEMKQLDQMRNDTLWNNTQHPKKDDCDTLSIDVLKMKTLSPPPPKDDDDDRPVHVKQTDVSSTEQIQSIAEVIPAPQSAPESSSSSSILQQQPHQPVEKEVEQQMYELEGTELRASGTDMDVDLHNDAAAIESVDTKTTETSRNGPITLSAVSQMLPSNTVDDSPITDDAIANNSSPHKSSDSVSETPWVTTTATFLDEQRKDVVMEIDESDKNEIMLHDLPNDSCTTVETLPMIDDVAVNKIERMEHTLEARTDNIVMVEMKGKIAASQQESPTIVDDTNEVTNVPIAEATELVEPPGKIASDVDHSNRSNDALQLKEKPIPIPTQMEVADTGTKSSLALNDNNIQTDGEIIIGENRISVDVVTTDTISKRNVVGVENDIVKPNADDVQVELSDEINKNETGVTATTAVENVEIATTTSDKIVERSNHDEISKNTNVEAEEVPPIDLDTVQTTSAVEAPTSIAPSIVKNGDTATTHSAKDEVDDNGNMENLNETTAVIDTKSENMDIGIVNATNISKAIDTTTDTTADGTTDPVSPVIHEHDTMQEDMLGTVPSSASARNTDPSINTIADIKMDDVIVDDTMDVDPTPAVDEEISESNTNDNIEESVLPPVESKISQIPVDLKINTALTDNMSSTLDQIDVTDKSSVNVVPPEVSSTKTSEVHDAGTTVDSQSEALSSTNKLKRSSPHTVPLQSDEPPKKKLTIRIPIHKMKQKASNTDIVTTPKSIHISRGDKEVTETFIGSSSPPQQALDTLSSKKDVTDSSALSPRQLKKLAFKLERKRQKMMAQKNSAEVETSETMSKDSILIDKSNDSTATTKNDADSILTPTTETSETDDHQIRLERQGALGADSTIDAVMPSTTTSEENIGKKKKKGVRRKGVDGDSDPKTSKENENEVDDSQWVQCDECGKWRIIPTRVVQELPKQWYCRDNIYDPKHSSCDAPEQTDKEVAKEKKRRLKKKQRLLKSAEEAAVAALLSHEAGTHSNDTAIVKENAVESSPRPPRDAVVDIEKPPKQQKRMSSMEESQLPELPLATTESRPPKKDKKIASTVKRGRSVESMDKLLTSSEDVVGAVAVPDVVKPRGRGRPRRANNGTGGGSTNTSTTKEAIPIGGTSSSAPTPSATDDGENLEWVQCEKCDKWRKLPPHVSADDLPDVWTCTMNTWNPSSASCDAPEDKSDGLQDIGVFGTNGSAAGKLTYRHLIFGSNGRKANRPISEKTCAAESIFSAHFDEDVAPTKVLYADSSAYISRGRPNISVDDNEGMSVLELMSHSKLWQELRGISSSPSQLPQPSHPPTTSLFNNETLRMNAYTYDTLPADIQGPMKECVIRSLDSDTLSGDEVVQRIQQRQLKNGTTSAMDEKILPYCTATVIVTTLCDLVKIGTVECLQKIGTSATTDCWNPHYRRKVQRVTPVNDHQQQKQQQQKLHEQHTIMSSSSSVSQELQQQRRRLSFPMKLSKPWKHAKM